MAWPKPALGAPGGPATSETSTWTVSPVGVKGTTLTVKLLVPLKSNSVVTSGFVPVDDWVSACCEPSVTVTAPLKT